MNGAERIAIVPARFGTGTTGGADVDRTSSVEEHATR